jgi:glutamyl-tRNA reductase
MELVVVGLNHKTASIEIRERLAFPEEKLNQALCQAHGLPSIKEDIILSTCNRVEIFAAAKDMEAALLEIKHFLADFHRLSLKEFESALYLHSGEEAVRHIFRVASSLDSMVVGEPQILGQIKEAYDAATQTKTSGLVLHKLLHQSFHVAKRVRTETKIANSAVSISSVAVDLARKIFETLEKKTVLLIGAGEMCELAAQHLISGGIEKVLVANRTYERAVSLAGKFGGEPIPFAEIPVGLRRADIVISATNSPQYVLLHEQVGKVMKERRQKPIFLIDIADPRDIDPRIDDIENVYLYNIDHLQKIANENIRDREKEAIRAEAIVEDEVTRFVGWYRSLDVTPTIVALRKKFDEIRRRELEKTLAIHPDLSDKERKSLEAMTSAIVNKILHEPLTLLKKTNGESSADLYLDAIQALFQLSGEPGKIENDLSKEATRSNETP